MSISTKLVMQNAHNFARQGVLKFGGKHSDYMSLSMQRAWHEAKQAEQKIIVIRVSAMISTITILFCVWAMFILITAIIYNSGLYIATIGLIGTAIITIFMLRYEMLNIVITKETKKFYNEYSNFNLTFDLA